MSGLVRVRRLMSGCWEVWCPRCPMAVAMPSTWGRAMLRAGEHAREVHGRGRRLIWIAKYMRYRFPGEEECDSLEEAIRFLYWGEENGHLAGVEIIGPDGQPVDAWWYELPDD